MNNEIILPVAIIILIGVIIAIIFLNRKDEKELEENLNQGYPKKRSSDTDEGEKQTI